MVSFQAIIKSLQTHSGDTALFNEVGIIPAGIASGFAAEARPLYCPYRDNLGAMVKAQWKFGKSFSTSSGAVTATEMEA